MATNGLPSIEHEERLLEGMAVTPDLAAGIELDQGDRQMGGTMLGREEGCDADALSLVHSRVR
jgi:hypothetical protein